MKVVTIYTKDLCPYCDRAKRLLREKGVENYTEIRIDHDEQHRNHMIEITGKKTVPQIFIGSVYVGGFDDLAQLNSEGKLDELINA